MPERTSALLMLINVALLFALGVAAYSGWLAMIWHADVLKISFIIIPAFFITGFGLSLGWISDGLADEVAERLPMIALMGTVAGMIIIFSAIGAVKIGGAGDIQSLLPPILKGGASAMYPTLLGIAGSNILWFQLLIRRRWGA